MNDLTFNPTPSTILHIDLNSCFATIEQQANPHLRGKPVAVAAYTTPSGCILAPSVEAKRYGIRTGTRVREGRKLCPGLIVLPPDPWKYRNVHLALRKILGDYTNDFNPKSIDEFVLNLKDYLTLSRRTDDGNETINGKQNDNQIVSKTMLYVGKQIKMRIRREIGDWLTVSIGIAPNRFLAKTASSLNKPDGLDEINKANHLEIFKNLKLVDLCGIKIRNAARLNSMGIYTVLDFYKAPVWKLKAAFSSTLGYYWYLRLHGFQIDDVEFGRRSYGNSYALPAGRQVFQTSKELAPILTKLVTKMGARLRRAGYKAKGVHLAVSYRDGRYWHKGITYPRVFFDSRDIYKEAFKMLSRSPYQKPVRTMAVSCFGLLKSEASQLELFDDVENRQNLVKAVDKVNEHWGDFVVTPARMLRAKDDVQDRIAFGQPADATRQQSDSLGGLQAGNVKELEEFTIKSQGF